MNDSGIESVRRMAVLARLEVGEVEAQALALQFERILGQFQVLARLDVPRSEERADPLRPADQRRGDDPRPCLPVEGLLANAPARSGDFYRVPKTVGGEE